MRLESLGSCLPSRLIGVVADARRLLSEDFPELVELTTPPDMYRLEERACIIRLPDDEFIQLILQVVQESITDISLSDCQDKDIVSSGYVNLFCPILPRGVSSRQTVAAKAPPQ